MDRPLASTEWSVVLAAGQSEARAGSEALSRLCERYWAPVYWLIRHQVRDVEEARDETQEFFARLIEKHWLSEVRPERGSFRSFLFSCVKHFLANERDRARALKRGGGTHLIALDRRFEDDGPCFEPIEPTTPESEFEQRWAVAVLESAMTRLRATEEAAGRLSHFEALTPALTGEGDCCSYRELAKRLGTTEGAMKVEVHRLRRRFGAALRAEVGATVADPQQVDAELRFLLGVLTRR